MKRGMFIVIEGGDGSGKSSAVSWLKDELKGGNIVFTREPGGTEAGEKIRETLVKKRDEDLGILTQILLFEASRHEHMVKKVIPALERGTHVICDRFSGSTYAYQICAGGGRAYEELFLTLDAAARTEVEPDATIYLDVDPAEGLKRKHASGDELNTFDEKELEFYTIVREGIRTYLKTRPHTIIDAGKPQSEVREEVKRAILSYIQ